MALRAANRHEKRPESLLHPIKWTGLVKVGAAMAKARPVLRKQVREMTAELGRASGGFYDAGTTGFMDRGLSGQSAKDRSQRGGVGIADRIVYRKRTGSAQPAQSDAQLRKLTRDFALLGIDFNKAVSLASD